MSLRSSSQQPLALSSLIPSNQRGPTKHRKGATKDLLNTAKYDQGL